MIDYMVTRLQECDAVLPLLILSFPGSEGHDMDCLTRWLACSGKDGIMNVIYTL